MDPNACFDRILEALADRDHEEAFYGCNDLISWLHNGGAPIQFYRQEPSDEASRQAQIAALKELRRLLKLAQA